MDGDCLDPRPNVRYNAAICCADSDKVSQCRVAATQPEASSPATPEFPTLPVVSNPEPVPQFEINLDAAPEDRYVEVLKHFAQPLSELFDNLANNTVVLHLAKKISDERGPENDELMGEIRGIAKVSGIPEYAIHAAQLLYELQTLMVPITNITWPWDMEGADEAVVPELPRFGCTGIIAKNEADGTVYHARNLDFSLAKYLQHMAYNAVFTRGGKEVYTAQMIAGYSAVLTGIKRGSNGYTIEINTRYGGKFGTNKELFKHLFTEKRPISGWVKRETLDNITDYEDAVQHLSTTPYAATEYNIISGVKKGVILARDPDGLAYKLELGDNRYIIMTNFDYVYHDIKEWFDPTCMKGIGHSRRKGAEKILDKSATLTPELLFSVLNDEGVIATDTIFQAIMNVERNQYNTSLPHCKECVWPGTQ